MTPGPEDEVTQAERLRILREGTTFHQHAQAQANELSGGRFAAIGVPIVTGATPIPKYPAASTPFQSDPVPDEPPLGIDINELGPSAGLSAAEATGGAAAPSAPPDVEPAPPLSKDQDNG